jgi:hypothetical protein
MSIGDIPTLKSIADIVGDEVPYRISDMRGILFTTGNSPETGVIKLSDFRGKTFRTIYKEYGEILQSGLIQYGFYGRNIKLSTDGTTVAISRYDTATVYVYIYSGGQWSQQAELASNPVTNITRSLSISGDGNTVVCGAWDGAYLFTRSGSQWSQKTTLFPSGYAWGGTDYGFAVSISGDGSTVVVGAPYDDTGIKNSGAAYSFHSSDGWTTFTSRRILPLNYEYHILFGSSMELSHDGRRLVVGAPGGGLGNTYTYAFIYGSTGVTWNLQKTFTSWSWSGFGSSVSLNSDGTTVAIGAPRDSILYVSTETALSGWPDLTQIVPVGMVSDYRFCESVSVSGDGNVIVAGATNELNGSVYIFRKSTEWNQINKFNGVTELGAYGYGITVSGDGSKIFVTAPAGPGGGNVYVINTSYFV